MFLSPTVVKRTFAVIKEDADKILSPGRNLSSFIYWISKLFVVESLVTTIALATPNSDCIVSPITKLSAVVVGPVISVNFIVGSFGFSKFSDSYTP